MKNKTIILFGMLCVFSCGYLSAQNIRTDTLMWSCSRATNVTSNQVFDLPYSFVNRGETSVDWIQNNGQKTYHLSVVGVEGTWPNVATDGSITYKLGGATPGQLTFERAGGALSIRLFIKPPKAAALNYTFSVTSIARN